QCHVAAKADEGSALSRRGERRRGGEIGGERLGRGTQIDLDAARYPRRPSVVVESDPLPAGDAAHREWDGPTLDRNGREVGVVADRLQGPAHRRVHRSRRYPCPTQGGSESCGEKRAQLPVVLGRSVQPAQLAVLPEPATRLVDGPQEGIHYSLRPAEAVRAGDHHSHGRAERAIVHAGDHQEAPLTAWVELEVD